MVLGGLSSRSADVPHESGLRRSSRCVRAASGFHKSCLTAKSLKSRTQTGSGCVGPRPGARDRASPREITPWVRRMLRVRLARGVASCVACEGCEQVFFPVLLTKLIPTDTYFFLLFLSIYSSILYFISNVLKTF